MKYMNAILTLDLFAVWRRQIKEDIRITEMSQASGRPQLRMMTQEFRDRSCIDSIDRLDNV